ncbi:MAG: hypothetical protein QE263_01775 [Vampirovibrionales bacterium]|nr:hypothetical protein [Vampirovibrionales bacterium]
MIRVPFQPTVYAPKVDVYFGGHRTSAKDIYFGDNKDQISFSSYSVTSASKPKAIVFSKDSREFQTAAHELGHALTYIAWGIPVKAIRLGQNKKMKNGLVKVGSTHIGRGVTSASFDFKNKDNDVGALRAAFNALAGYAFEDWASLGTLKKIFALLESGETIRTRQESSDFKGFLDLILNYIRRVSYRDSKSVKEILGKVQVNVIFQSEKIIRVIGKEKYKAMTQDLANKKELKTPKEVEAFFEKHLGKNYNWKPVQELIDATFT